MLASVDPIVFTLILAVAGYIVIAKGVSLARGIFRRGAK